MLKKMVDRLAFLFAFLLAMSAPGVWAQSVPNGLNPGPDAITGDMDNLASFGSNGTQLGLGIGTTICNAGNVEVNFLAMPNTDHPFIAHNLYRMSSNNERFEQIGQSWVKHAFGASAADICGFGCIPSGTITRLGVGCSDAYDPGQSANQNLLGSRAWVNPFTGVFPPNARDHTGHDHTGTSHRLLVESVDVNNTVNPGASYFAEVQYITPNEYAWCQTHPGQCNMYNNTSHLRYNVGAGPTFLAVGSTVRMNPAITAWTGATINPIEPEPGVDGRAFIACKVTGPVGGAWHYEYALYNQNLDRGIQSFRVPLGGTITVSNLGFHAPLNHPGFANDGTVGDAGYSNAAWASTQTVSDLSWSSESFAQNQNANAIRWGTLCNFRFDSNRPPLATSATIGFFKTGAPVTVGIQGPDPSNATPSPTVAPTATPTPIIIPTPVPGGRPARAVNLSTRMQVGTGDHAGIAGFIISGNIVPKRVLIRAIGPSLALSGVPNVLADPVLELHGPGGLIVTNDNWQDDPGQVEQIMDTGLAPLSNRESAILLSVQYAAYTAVVRGKDNSVGTALVEVYDVLNTGLGNVSTRAVVSTGDNVVIAGVILGGVRRIGPVTNTGAARIVVRGVGPALATVGVDDPLANPMLELRDANGALVVANDDWLNDPAQAAEVASLHFEPRSPLEPAFAATLPRGAYTVLLSGVNNGTGVGVVEIFDLTPDCGECL